MLGEVVGSLSEIFGAAEFPQLLAGIAQTDDAAVYQIDEERAVIATADFFPPVVDDAFDLARWPLQMRSQIFMRWAVTRFLR